MNENSKRAALAALQEKLSPNWAEFVGREFLALNYTANAGRAPSQYDVSYSDVCWGWLVAGPAVNGVVATFGHGERGNEVYDLSADGLAFWQAQS